MPMKPEIEIRDRIDEILEARDEEFAAPNDDSFLSSEDCRAYRTNEAPTDDKNSLKDADQTVPPFCTASSEVTGIKEKKHVRFVSEDPIVYSIPSWKTYTAEERRALFYQRQDYEEITKACCKEILKLFKGRVLRDKKYCARGLESHAPRAALTRAMTKQAATAIVLAEQRYQRSEGIRNEDLIAEVYRDATSSSQVWANRMGMMDQRAAEEAMDQD